MGHTVSSTRMVVKQVLREIKEFISILRIQDRPYIQHLLKYPYQHIGSMSFVASVDVWAFVLMGMIIEQQKKIEELQRDLNRHLQSTKPDNTVAQEWSQKYSVHPTLQSNIVRETPMVYTKHKKE